MFSQRLNQWAPLVLSILRIVVGLLLLDHGMAKIIGFPVSQMNPPPMSLPWIAGVIELVTGVLLIIGLFTRPAAFLASGLCAFAYFIGHAPKNFFPVNNGGDAAILFCFIALYIFFAGGGPIGLDAKSGRA
ncbi:DoxX family protein [Rhizobium paknamense]|uniref:Oxidoreductase n=1 Tax=Rhizobium paknamense TaxID=1206817 RepID=A0ABU0I9F2_9HYPH|nr:DoxX family protein [Rhizobium paknamense]MDQ0454842.1 putative oxidoreductase [Rhizobium paknamense]